MGSSCCYLAQSCSTFAKNSTLGNLDDVFFTGGRKQHEEGGTDLGSRFQGGPLNKSKACQRTLWTLCLVNTIPWAPILVLSLVMGLTAPKLLIEKSHEIYSSESQNFGSCALKYIFIVLMTYFGRKANMFELQDWNSSNLSNFWKLQHNSSISSRREEPCYSSHSTSKHWNNTCLLPCSSRNNNPRLNTLF